MPRRKTVAMNTAWVLQPGYYLVDGTGEVQTRTIRKKNKETKEFEVHTVPIRCRTIATAKDVVLLSDGRLCILGVVTEDFAWG